MASQMENLELEKSKIFFTSLEQLDFIHIIRRRPRVNSHKEILDALGSIGILPESAMEIHVMSILEALYFKDGLFNGRRGGNTRRGLFQRCRGGKGLFRPTLI